LLGKIKKMDEEYRVRTSITKPGESIIAIRSSFHTGNSLGPLLSGNANNAFGLCLVKDSSRNYILIVYMKIQFIFENNKSLRWNQYEKTNFIDKFENLTNQKWGNLKQIKTLSKGNKVFLDYRFLSSYDNFSIGDHWDVYVKKIPRGSFDTSYVNQYLGIVQLDSEDFEPVTKRNGNGNTQRGAIHEFGHMIGLSDEYKAHSEYANDISSIMNRGEIVSFRHHSNYLNLLNKILTEKGIK